MTLEKWDKQKRGKELNKINRVGIEKYNNQGCLMKIIKYNDANNIIVEFQDDYKFSIKTQYRQFLDGEVKNPYYPSVYGVGIVGVKYSQRNNAKEYNAWKTMLERCFDANLVAKHNTYENTHCCDEWLYFENFYKWLHEQENFDRWLNGERWDVDKDILIKGNKLYSPETCCLVPHNINSLFTKSNATRGDLPIGVTRHYERYQAGCNNLLIGKRVHIGTYDTPEQTFLAYKKYKENLIKQVAQEEYNKGNITRKCYEAMMNYEVEITD